MAVLLRPGVIVGLLCWLVAAALWAFNPSQSRQAVARPIPIPAATTNAYWAGYVSTERGPYTAVRASWTVPSTSCTNSVPSSAAYVWIGEGGYVQGLSSPLIQAGTGVDCFAGMPSYHAFYEWYPGIYATNFPITVRAGDTMTVDIEEARPDYWLLSVRDETSGAKSAISTFYRADTASVDFIVERPTFCTESGCQQASLARFGTVTFTDLRVRSVLGEDLSRLPSALPIALTDPATDKILAVPGWAPTPPSTLSVLWRQN